MMKRLLSKISVGFELAKLRSHVKTLARRHLLVFPAFVLTIAAILLPWQHFTYANDNSGATPSQVIIEKATVLEHSVHLSWLKAQAGDYPVARYVIERSSDGDKFTQVGTTASDTLEFTDLNGKLKDSYQVTAEDDQKPAHRSVKSEIVVADLVQPGENATVTTGSPLKRSFTGQSVDSKIIALQSFTNAAVKKINDTASEKDTDSLRAALASLQDYQRQILTLLPSLTPLQKASIAYTAGQQTTLLDTRLHQLSPTLEMDGLFVQAGYEAIQETAK